MKYFVQLLVFLIFQDQFHFQKYWTLSWNYSFVPKKNQLLHSRGSASRQHFRWRWNENILYIDDELPLLDAYTKILRALGYKVNSFSKSPDALKEFIINSDKYDLIITDYAMPKLNWLELEKKMHTINKDIPIILTSWFKENLNGIFNDWDYNFSSFIQKPITKIDIAFWVRKILDSQNEKGI